MTSILNKCASQYIELSIGISFNLSFSLNEISNEIATHPAVHPNYAMAGDPNLSFEKTATVGII